MGRRLIVFADGTWNTADQTNGGTKTPTNVIRLARAVRPVAADGTSQIIYYHDGVGTQIGSRLVGGALGAGINRSICDCYRFLIQNYADGDEIFLFGFSRGAYTVRSLVGLVRNSGLLRPEDGDRIPDAFELYRDRTNETEPAAPRSKVFRDKFSREVRIKCIGVWDTVGALGVPHGMLNLADPFRYDFHDVTLSSWVANAFHALAIDERRGPFEPSIWEQQPGADQRLEQVWFSGVHSNVGGGYPDTGLSDIALEWMIDRAEECGLAFNREYLARTVHPTYDAILEKSKRGVFRFGQPHIREIGKERRDTTGRVIDTCESVHPTAVERFTTVVAPPHGPYRPENLIAYLKRRASRDNANAASIPGSTIEADVTRPADRADAADAVSKSSRKDSPTPNGGAQDRSGRARK